MVISIDQAGAGTNTITNVTFCVTLYNSSPKNLKLVAVRAKGVI